MSGRVKPFYFMGHYHAWWKSRIETLDAILAPGVFKNKSVLDLGSGFGTFASLLKERGANIICSEGRQEYINIIESRFNNDVNKEHNIDVRLDDYDTICDFPSVDIITSFGVLYCIRDIEAHIANLAGRSKYMLLETDVVDSDDPNLDPVPVQQNGYDQAISGTGTYVSEKYIERLLSNNGFTFIQVQEPTLNTMVHKYNWPIKNTGKYSPGQARFWICSQAGYKLGDIFYKKFNNCVTPLFDPLSPSIRTEQFKTICTDEFLDSCIEDNCPRINLYTSRDNIDSSLEHLKTHGYIIYGEPYKSSLNENLYSILAVTPSIYAKEKYSFVIQGIPSGVTTEMLRNIVFQYGVVIDAAWKEEELKWANLDILSNNYYNFQNVFLQVSGTLRGLERVKTDFAFKIRADEYYTNLSPFIDKLNSNPDIVLCNNIFARKSSQYIYHISDHLLAGKTCNLLGMFREALQSLKDHKLKKNIVAEQRLTMCYIAWRENLTSVEDISKEIEKVTQLMKQYFLIVSVRELGEFQVRSNSMVRKTFTNNSSHRDYRFFIDIESIDDI